VDNNVTRHLDWELVSKDWDVLILHYLGLDHVGHLGGPRRYGNPPSRESNGVDLKHLYETETE